MDPAKNTRRPCPRCGGTQEFKHTVESLRTGTPVDFFAAKTAAKFIQLNVDLIGCAFGPALEAAAVRKRV